MIRRLMALAAALWLWCGLGWSLAAEQQTASTPEQLMQQLLEQQVDELDMEQFDQYLQGETEQLLGGRDSRQVLWDILRGQPLGEEQESLWSALWEWLRQQLLGGLSGITQILAIILIGGLLSSLCSVDDPQSRRLATMICGLCCVLASMSTFSGMAQQGIHAIERITDLVRVLVPVMAGVLIWGGRALSATSMPVLVLGLCAVLNEIIKAIFLPLVYGYIAISCAGAAFEDRRFDGVADLLRSVAQWGLGLCFTIFAGLMSLQASSLRIADNTIARTFKFAVGSFVPVVGRVLSDVSDIVLGCGNMISGGLGLFGILACLAVCGGPLLQALVYSLLYRLLTAVSQISGSDGLSRVLQAFSGAFALLFALCAAVSTLFIIAFAMVAGGGR
ncbi:MAG: stage III sporulation protein AE [Eubacteriales bacterium]